VSQFAVTVERVIKAPRAQVYRAWLDPTVLARWMGPDDFTVVVAEVDERIGGRHFVEMIDADGEHHTFTSVIEELVPEERIVLTFRFHWDAEDTLLTLTFADAQPGVDDGGTALRLQHERITLHPPLDGRSVDTGWSQTLAKLQALYAS
jgi:uncharacterized protein YndB with AHSA1/START domain